jgi:carboxymethylenebutenolidase
MKTTALFAAVAMAAASLPAQDWALKRLEDSPRHHEWVEITHGDRTVHCFLTYPESSEKTTAVIVIHENRGLTDWVRGVTDQLAEAGYIAIAPDLLSGMAPDGGKTSDYPNSDAAREGIYGLPPEQVTADLEAVRTHLTGLPASNGKVAVSGFCWGGSQSFNFATRSDQLAAAFVFYGTGPEDADAIRRIACSVHGFYGGNDARVNATIPKSQELMKEAGKTYEPVIHDGAGHGFMRSGEQPDADEANAKAREAAWKRWKELLGKL